MLLALAGGVFLAGLVLFGQGAWIRAKAVLAQILLDRAFAMPAGESAKPWPWADVEAVARISAPRLGRSQIVLSDASGEAMAFGPGHLAGTPQPGERGTAVYAAHRDTHFSWLGDLRPGDRIAIETRTGSSAGYRIRRAWIAPYDASGIDADSDESLVALVTCWPLDGSSRGPLRYIVEGELVADGAAAALTAGRHIP